MHRAMGLGAYCRPVGQDFYSPNAGVNEAVQWLLEYGYPVLPIAPRNEARLQGKLLYSGKNPSYLEPNGNARLVNQTHFFHRLPRRDELKRWFAHEATGIATLGGWHSTVWIDIDHKHFYSPEACTAVVRRLLQQHPQLRRTVIERSQSGGYHIGVRCRQLPAFTRCCLGEDQQPLGDLIGAGKVCVMAPTQGTEGHYQSLQRAAPVWVQDMTELGIAPKHVPRPVLPEWSQPGHQQTQLYHSGAVDLRRLLSQRVRSIVLSKPAVGDRSGLLTAVAREAFGWEHLAHQYGLTVHPGAEWLCLSVGQHWQLDSDRVQRVLNSTSYGRPVRESTPGLYTAGGLGRCLEKLRSVSQG